MMALIFSWYGMFAIAALLFAGAYYAFLNGRMQIATICVCIGIAQLYSGSIYQKGRYDCRKETAAAVAKAEARWAGVVTQAQAATSADLDALSDERDRANAELAALEVKYANRPTCTLETQDEVNAVNGR